MESLFKVLLKKKTLSKVFYVKQPKKRACIIRTTSCLFIDNIEKWFNVLLKYFICKQYIFTQFCFFIYKQ